jgi:hypothetical protein
VTENLTITQIVPETPDGPEEASVELTPGERIVVVQNREAFEAKDGTGAKIAGQYTGRLDPG